VLLAAAEKEARKKAGSPKSCPRNIPRRVGDRRPRAPLDYESTKGGSLTYALVLEALEPLLLAAGILLDSRSGEAQTCAVLQVAF
jgi:hypothetical protein